MIGVCSGLSATHNVETALRKAKATIQDCFQRDVLLHQRRGGDVAIPDVTQFTSRLYSLRKNARLVAPASCRLSRGRPALGISRRDAGATSFVLGHATLVPSRCHLGAIVYAPATGAMCSAADRHSPVSKGSRAKWPEEPWGRTSRALIFLRVARPR